MPLVANAVDFRGIMKSCGYKNVLLSEEGTEMGKGSRIKYFRTGCGTVQNNFMGDKCMKQNTTILFVVHNEKEKLQISIEAIRNCIIESRLQIVVIDNASNDGTKEWLSEQQDVAFAIEDKKINNWGLIINEAMEVFGIDGDIFLLQPGYQVSESCINELKKTLYAEEKIAAVGPLINGKYFEHDFVTYPKDDETVKAKRVLGLMESAVMIRGDALDEIKFDTTYSLFKYVIIDYLLRLIKAGKHIYCTAGADVVCHDMEKSFFNHTDEQNDIIKIRDMWGMQYFSTGNSLLVDNIVEDCDVPVSVLEIGCDCGATLLEVKNRYPNAEIYGCEINEKAACIARSVAEVEIGNIEEYNLPFKAGKFDYILFGDVLEHLHNPAEVIRYCRSLLKEKGHIVASIPNLMHISVVKDLLEGNFTYTEVGLLDKTHIHFFTLYEIIRMFAGEQYNVEGVINTFVPITQEEEMMLEKIMSIVQHKERWMFETFQYVVKAQKQ